MREPVQRAGLPGTCHEVGMVRRLGPRQRRRRPSEHALAARGHDVTLISSEPPFRWRPDTEGLSFERVMVGIPCFAKPQHSLALANSIVRIAVERELEIVHAHYAVPHATAAYLADRILRSMPEATPLRTITTLHGGHHADRRRSVLRLRGGLFHRAVPCRDGRVGELTGGHTQPLAFAAASRSSPTFDTETYRRRPDPRVLRPRSPPPISRSCFTSRTSGQIVKRVDAALEVFRRIRQQVPAALSCWAMGPNASTSTPRRRERPR